MPTFREVYDYLLKKEPVRLLYATNESVTFTATADKCMRGRRRGQPIIRITSGTKTNILIYKEDWGKNKTTGGTLVRHVYDSLAPYVRARLNNPKSAGPFDFYESFEAVFKQTGDYKPQLIMRTDATRRVETGGVQFDGDCTGYFIRGDDCINFTHRFFHLLEAVAALPKEYQEKVWPWLSHIAKHVARMRHQTIGKSVTPRAAAEEEKHE